MNSGLFPATTFVRTDLAIEMGQLTPKQTSINVSKMLTRKHHVDEPLRSFRQPTPCMSYPYPSRTPGPPPRMPPIMPAATRHATQPISRRTLQTGNAAASVAYALSTSSLPDVRPTRDVQTPHSSSRRCRFPDHTAPEAHPVSF